MPSSVCLKSLDQTKENILLLSHGTMNYLLSFNGLNTQPSYHNVTIHNQSGSWFSPLFISFVLYTNLMNTKENISFFFFVCLSLIWPTLIFRHTEIYWCWVFKKSTKISTFWGYRSYCANENICPSYFFLSGLIQNLRFMCTSVWINARFWRRFI